MRKLGADEVFDYKETNVVDAIRKAAGDQGVFAAYDTAGHNVKECIGMCHLLTALLFCLGSSIRFRLTNDHLHCFVTDAISSQGGRVMSTTPPDESLYKRRSNVLLEFVIVYTIVGYPVSVC